MAEYRSAEAARLISLVEAEGIHYGREDSVKLSHGSVLAERFMLGIPMQAVTPERIVRWWTALGMPERFRTLASAQLSDANLVFLGIEQGEDECVFKIYLEFWDNVRRQVARTRRATPLLLHLGFKWRAGSDGADGRIARYTCFPLLSVRKSLTRIGAIYDGATDLAPRDIATDIIRRAAAANRDALFLYAEVAEEGTPRKSFDINLYKADLTLDDIRPDLERLQRYFCIPDPLWTPLIKRAGAQPLGHLSGGLDRASREFMTVYYETRPLDP